MPSQGMPSQELQLTQEVLHISLLDLLGTCWVQPLATQCFRCKACPWEGLGNWLAQVLQNLPKIARLGVRQRLHSNCVPKEGFKRNQDEQEDELR